MIEFKKGPVSIITFDGEIVFENSNKTKNKAKEILRVEGVDQVIVDLSRVPYLDSSGVGVLISLFKSIREKEGRLVLASPTKKVERVIELTLLHRIMEVYDNVNEAMESF